jgi:hypothetical protein
MLDSIKARRKAAAGGDLDNLSEEARAEIEQAEDEFVGQTEEAVSVMKNVCFVRHLYESTPALTCGLGS